MKVEILYFSGCPNRAPAVDLVREVLEQEGAPADMVEVEVRDASTAETVGFLGSPTIRVDGRDVEHAARAQRGFVFAVPDFYRWQPAGRRAAAGINSRRGARSKGRMESMNISTRQSRASKASASLW